MSFNENIEQNEEIESKEEGDNKETDNEDTININEENKSVEKQKDEDNKEDNSEKKNNENKSPLIVKKHKKKRTLQNLRPFRNSYYTEDENVILEDPELDTIIELESKFVSLLLLKLSKSIYLKFELCLLISAFNLLIRNFKIRTIIEIKITIYKRLS